MKIFSKGWYVYGSFMYISPLIEFIIFDIHACLLDCKLREYCGCEKNELYEELIRVRFYCWRWRVGLAKHLIKGVTCTSRYKYVKQINSHASLRNMRFLILPDSVTSIDIRWWVCSFLEAQILFILFYFISN